MADAVERAESPDSVGAALVLAAREHRVIVARELSLLGIYPGQEFMLLALRSQGAMTQSALGTALRVEPPTVTKMVRRLAAGDLVERFKDLKDGRLVRIGLTPKGDRLCDHVERVWDQAERRMTEGLTDQERGMAEELLGRMYDNLARLR